MYQVNSHAQATMWKEQRIQRDYFNRKVHDDPFKPSDLVGLFEPHKAKSRKFYSPCQGPHEVLNWTSDVTYKICKRGRPARWTKVNFNRLKAYIGEPKVRRPKRNAPRPTPLYEKFSKCKWWVRQKKPKTSPSTRLRPKHKQIVVDCAWPSKNYQS